MYGYERRVRSSGTRTGRGGAQCRRSERGRRERDGRVEATQATERRAGTSVRAQARAPRRHAHRLLLLVLAEQSTAQTRVIMPRAEHWFLRELFVVAVVYVSTLHAKRMEDLAISMDPIPSQQEFPQKTEVS